MIFTIKTQFNAATALSPQEAFRAKIVTPQRFLHELADFMSLMFGESLSGYIQKDDSSFCRKLNQPREIRYKRLVSVLRAYNLFMETVRHPQILRFVNGDFFNTGQITEDEAREELLKELRANAEIEINQRNLELLKSEADEVAAKTAERLAEKSAAVTE